MGNVQPKGVSRFDDADFGASFVLSESEVDAALATESVDERMEAAATAPPRRRWRKRSIFAAVAAAGLVAAAVLLALTR